MINLTRKHRRHQKQDISVFTTRLNFTDEIGDSGEDYALFTLPPGSLVTKAAIFVETPADSATSAVASLGFDGGAELLDGEDLTVDGAFQEGTATPVLRETGGVVTFSPTYTGATSAGKFMVVIEYIEYTKTTGEVTNFIEG